MSACGWLLMNILGKRISGIFLGILKDAKTVRIFVVGDNIMSVEFKLKGLKQGFRFRTET